MTLGWAELAADQIGPHRSALAACDPTTERAGLVVGVGPPGTPGREPAIPPDPAPTTAGGDHQRCGADPVIVPQQLDVPLDLDSMRQAGSGLGAGGFAVFGGSACMVQAAWQYSRFLFVESCGQCPACKFGTGEVTQTLRALEADAGRGLRSTAASAVPAARRGGQAARLPAAARCSIRACRPLMVLSTQRTPYR